MTTSDTSPAPTLVGLEVEVDVGPIAHGGHFVARHEGRVVFVRHAIPGETVVARVTEGREDSTFLRADAVQVRTASVDRVEPPCPYAGPDRCGGCDFQHVSLPRQRELLGAVVTEQLSRLAGLDWPVEVESVPGDHAGLDWRTRVRWSATADGRPGLRKHRSHDVVAVDRCRIAVADLPDVTAAMRDGATSAEAVRTAGGDRVVVREGEPAPVVEEIAAGRHWQLTAGDFWQVHPGAADALVNAVLDGVRPEPAERCWDLYAGVGLFSAPLAERVGPSGAVWSVESHRRASRHARSNLSDLPWVRCVADRVDRFVRSPTARQPVDLVVLDPPRAGAGADVLRQVATRAPRVIAYVACDPAALARDVARLAGHGYGLASLRAFDIFPMTHHVECVAILRPDGQTDALQRSSLQGSNLQRPNRSGG